MSQYFEQFIGEYTVLAEIGIFIIHMKLCSVELSFVINVSAGLAYSWGWIFSYDLYYFWICLKLMGHTNGKVSSQFYCLEHHSYKHTK